MAQKVTTVGELREALEDCSDDVPICSVTDEGKLKDLFIYGHEREITKGFGFKREVVVVFESDSPHWEFNL